MGRVIGWLRGLPLWGKILLGLIVVSGIAAAVASPPEETTDVAATVTSTTERVTTTTRRVTTTTQRMSTTTQRVTMTTRKLATTTTGRRASATTVKENARCLAIPQSTIDWIEDGLTVNGGGSLRFVRAVKSKDFESAYFVTADIEGSGLAGKSDLGTWVVNRIEGDSRLTYSVNAVAKEFSDWGDGGKTDAGFSMSDDGAEESQNCSKALAKAA